MRIVFVLHQFYPEFSGGTERVVLNLARGMQRAGHHVHVLACTMREPAQRKGSTKNALGSAFHEVYQGIPVTLIPRSQLPAAGDIGFEVAPVMVDQVRDWIRAQRFDLMHVFHAMRMSSALLAAQQCGLPYVATLTDFFTGCYRINAINAQGEPCASPQKGHACERDCLVPPWTAQALRQRYEQAQALLHGAAERVVPSEYVAAFFRNAFPEMHWRVIPHGIDFLALASKGTAIPSLATLPAHAGGRITLGYLGSIVLQKGIHILLKAMARVPSDRLRLRIAGGFYGDPVYQEDIRKMIKADPRIEWVGQIAPADVASELRRMDLLCLPSIVPESFSLSLHEAAVLGVPAMVSSLGAPRERIEKHGGGRVVTAGDVGAWAQALEHLLEESDALRSWRSSIQLPYRVEEEVFFYESLYRQLVVPA
jgi:glycosyltransferase involved in cell wall biosynthesis